MRGLTQHQLDDSIRRELEKLRRRVVRLVAAQRGERTAHAVWVKKHRKPAVSIRGHWRIVTAKKDEAP